MRLWIQPDGSMQYEVWETGVKATHAVLGPGRLEHLTHLDLSHNRFSDIPPVLSQLRPLLSLDLRGNPLTTCLLPLPWQIDRYIYPPDEDYVDFNYDHLSFDQWLLSSPTSTDAGSIRTGGQRGIGGLLGFVVHVPFFFSPFRLEVGLTLRAPFAASMEAPKLLVYTRGVPAVCP